MSDPTIIFASIANPELLKAAFIKLNNYVVQLIGVASVLSRHGSFTIFLLLNDMSHDAHFSTRQNIEPEDCLEKNQIFLFTGFPDI